MHADEERGHGWQLSGFSVETRVAVFADDLGRLERFRVGDRVAGTGWQIQSIASGFVLLESRHDGGSSPIPGVLLRTGSHVPKPEFVQPETRIHYEAVGVLVKDLGPDTDTPSETAEREQKE